MENQIVLRGTAPKESLIIRGTSCVQIVQKTLKIFHWFSYFWIKILQTRWARVALGLFLNIFCLTIYIIYIFPFPDR